MLPSKIKRCLIIFSVLAAAVVAFVIWFSCPEDKSCKCEIQREKVGFPHELHAGLFDCMDCHHAYDETHVNVLDPMELYAGNPDIQCLSCHTPEAKIDGMTAFHRQCMGCHNREAAAGRASGPNMCSECHQREDAIPAEYEMIIGD